MEASESDDTNVIAAELPGVLLQSDYDDVHAVEPISITEADIVAAAMKNANLTPSQEMAEMTGVDLSHDDDDQHDIFVVSDDEDEQEILEHEGDNDDEVVIMGNNPYEMLGTEYEEDADILEPNDADILDPDMGMSSNTNSNAENEVRSDNEEHRIWRSKRKKKKRK